MNPRKNYESLEDNCYKEFGLELDTEESSTTSTIPVFTHHMFELDKVEYIVPLGELPGGWMEAEANNLAMVEVIRPKGFGNPSMMMKVFAPVDMKLDSYSYYGFEGQDPSWTLLFSITPNIRLKFSALTDVSDRLKDEVGLNHTQGEIWLLPQISFKEGEMIGIAGGSEIHNWDVFLYDLNNTNQYVNQARYNIDYMGERYRTASCPFKYYPRHMQMEYEVLYGASAAGQTSSCGSASRDVRGTLSGIWYLSDNISEGMRPVREGMYTSPLFIYKNSAGGISLGYVNNKRYWIKRENPTNKDPVKISTQHCYTLYEPYDNSVDGYAFFKIISDTQMGLVVGVGKTCPKEFPERYKTYYR